MLAMWSNICGCENNCVHQSRHILCTFMPCLQRYPYINSLRLAPWAIEYTYDDIKTCYMCGNDDLLTVRLTN